MAIAIIRSRVENAKLGCVSFDTRNTTGIILSLSNVKQDLQAPNGMYHWIILMHPPILSDND